MSQRKVCVVTGSRADYGCMRWMLKALHESAAFELQIIATGMHLSPEFGLTYKEIEQDGLRIDRRIETLLGSDSSSGLAKSMGLGLIGFGDALQQLQPDLMFVLGDRFEIFAAASAAMVARIPIAHAHGGESTEGAFDEAIRHAITKMSHLHFVATEEYRRRVIQLGENPGTVFNVGGLGIDGIRRQTLLNRAELEQALGFTFARRNLMITFHPVTLEDATAAEQLHELLHALEPLQDTLLIFTASNADTGGRKLTGILEQFAGAHANARVFTSLGQLRYLSCLAQVDGVVGNSSSGLLEVPSFARGTINIGDRQTGRVKAESVLDCAPDRRSIATALDRLYSTEFQSLLRSVRNPYGEGGASERIVDILSRYPLGSLLKKKFHDLPSMPRHEFS